VRLKNKGQIERFTTLIINIMIMLIMFASAGYLVATTAPAELLAMNEARDIGAVFEVAMLASGDVKLINVCPSGTRFSVDGRSVIVESDSIVGDGTGEYYYTAPADAILPSNVVVNCKTHVYWILEKQIDPDSLETIVEVYGENKLE